MSTRELGGAVNVARYRTQAQAGSVVLQWLAAHADAPVDPQAGAAAATPNDANLLHAISQWLAVSDVQEDAVEQLSQPKESDAVPLPPVDLPAIVEDLLRAMGLSREKRGDDGAAHPRDVVALFHGAAGTGKTLAAHAVAEALGIAILRIDLDRVVSKYVGDTEKNLAAVFADAEKSGAVLFIDEADALFARRSEVEDAHDRYTNIEVTYLLQRIEAYDGLVILATNQRPRIDDPSVDERWRTRLRTIVPFPRPRH